MKYIDHTFFAPEENLACEEVLLDLAEEGKGEEVLYFWEPTRPLVVVGYSNAIHSEVYVDRCESRKIPVLRRCSGGGTVVQGPGCLNYCLVLSASREGLGGITSANRQIMDRNCRALQSLTTSKLEVRGFTDLVQDGFKICGNAQRRKKSHLLFHGTFLLDFDLQMIEALLPFPSKQPDYRENRSHLEFVRNLGVGADRVKRALLAEWGAMEKMSSLPLPEIEARVAEKYYKREWNYKF